MKPNQFINRLIVFSLLFIAQLVQAQQQQNVDPLTANPVEIKPIETGHFSTKQIDKVNLAVELPNMNVIYVGVDNPVHIVVNSNVSQLKFKIDSIATITGANGDYNIRVIRQNEIILSIFDEKDNLIGTRKFRAKLLPDSNNVPRILILDPSKQSTQKKVDTAFFKNITSVTPLFESGQISSSTKIISFQLTHVRKGIDPVELKSTSENFTKDMIEVLTHLKSGDKLYFEYIIVRNADESTRRIAPLNFLVK